MPTKLAVVGLGYVGLPLACHFAKHFPVIGFDTDTAKVAELQLHQDRTGEVSEEDLGQANLRFTHDQTDIGPANVYIIAVPTPLTESNHPDLRCLSDACDIVSEVLEEDDLVIIESTTYPGCTREFCKNILDGSGVGYKLAYSPERVVPGSSKWTVVEASKLVGGLEHRDRDAAVELYQKIVKNVVPVSSMEIAEAAKLLENTQRDVNIALMNELARICHEIEVNPSEVIQAASTKWNFKPFHPGLVGGHCISVDPYYLDHVFNQRTSPLIRAARMANDYVVDDLIFAIERRKPHHPTPRVGILGVTFKENVPDVRNSLVEDLAHKLELLDWTVSKCDPVVNQEGLLPFVQLKDLDVIVLAVPHDCFMRDPDFLESLKKASRGKKPLFVDVRGKIHPNDATVFGFEYWSWAGYIEQSLETT